MTSELPFDRSNWPIAAAMIPFPPVLRDGTLVQEQSVEGWAETLSLVVDAGFTELDPTDSWLRVADLSPERRRDFFALTKSLGLSIPGISTSRRSVIDPEHGDEYLAYCHRVIDTAAEAGAGAVCFGLFGPFTPAQQQSLWFWTAQGVKNPDNPEIWDLAVRRMRELGRHAAELGLELSLEMYEDTYLGSADEAVRFTRAVDLENVGICADIGNLIRLHQPVEHWRTMIEKVAPYMKYWHVKNYLRMEDPRTGAIVTHPTSLELGWINYREVIAIALAHGFKSAILLESYGGDGLSVCATNRQYLRRILPRKRSV